MKTPQRNKALARRKQKNIIKITRNSAAAEKLLNEFIIKLLYEINLEEDEKLHSLRFI